LLQDETDKGHRAEPTQPSYPRFFEPVPATTLAKNVGEAELGSGNKNDAKPIERAFGTASALGAFREHEDTGSRQGERYGTEENPAPRLNVEQPALKSGRRRSRRDDRSHGKQSLQDGLKAARIRDEKEHLSRDEQRAA